MLSQHSEGSLDQNRDPEKAWNAPSVRSQVMGEVMNPPKNTKQAIALFFKERLKSCCGKKLVMDLAGKIPKLLRRV